MGPQDIRLCLESAIALLSNAYVFHNHFLSDFLCQYFWTIKYAKYPAGNTSSSNESGPQLDHNVTLSTGGLDYI